MKKAISLLLALALSLSVLPFSVLAEDPSPALYFKWAGYDEDGNLEEDDTFSRSLGSRQLGYSNEFTVYFVSGDDATLLSPDALEFEGSCCEMTATEYVLCLNYIAVGDGAITYTVDGVSYSIPVTVTLPRVALYSASTASEEAYLGRRLTYTGKDDVYYILPEDGWKITDLTLRNDNMDFFSYDLAEDGSLVTVTLSDGFTDEWYRIRLTLTSINDPDDYYSTNIGFNVSDTSPGLRFKWAWYDENDELAEEDGDFEASLTRELGGSNYFSLYYAEGETATRLSYDDLRFEGNIFDASEEDNFLYLDYTHVGTGAITYTKDGTTYKLPVTVTLPDVGFYSTPTASEEAYLKEILSAMPGETATAYLLWDESFGALEDYTVKLRTDDGWTAITDDLSAYGLLITESGKNYCKIEAVTGEAHYFRMDLSFENNSCSAWLEVLNIIDAKDREWRQYDETPTFTYDGHTYSFSIGKLEESGRFHLYGGGGAFGSFDDDADWRYEDLLHLLAIMDLDTTHEQAAPGWVLDCISNVSFTIEDWLNLPLTDDQTAPYLSTTPAAFDEEYKMYYTVLSAEPGLCGYALLRIDFTVTFPGQEPVDCTVRLAGHRTCNTLIRAVIGDDIDTAEELNAIFSSKEAFLTYWQKEQPDTYQEYISTKAAGLDYTLEIDLPAVVYDAVVEFNFGDLDWPFVCGTTKDGVTTTMPGLHVNRCDCFMLSDINFVADPDITQNYDGETFTCGIFAYSVDPNHYYGDVNINWCTFTGFDYGIRCAAGSYASANGNNVFESCKIGCYLDCSNKYSGNGNDRISYAIFRNCSTAIKLTGLPRYISAYAFRVFRCDFIDNDLDFDVQQGGNFYFYRNYYGTIGAVATDAIPHTVRLLQGSGTTVYTNPRYAFPLMAIGDTEYYNYLYLDSNFETALLNAQASELALDVEALEAALDETDASVSIDVLDDNEQVQGTWIFNATEE